MNTIEEQIWDYIDGNCTAEEKLVVEAKIASDEKYNMLYQEFSMVNQQLNQIDTDEPSMAFNRKILDLIGNERAPVSLKTKVDQRIIYLIGGIFIFMMAAILIYAVSQTDFTFSGMESLNLNFTAYLNPVVIKVFLFTDLLLGFLYFDSFLRRKKSIK
jgi:anti-sigma factor RsiW